MQRRIVGFHEDDHGEWVAELDCGHSRHVRHRPPLRSAPWVFDADERRGRIGELLDCHRCEQGCHA